MAKISLRLDKRRARNDGSYPLKVAVSRAGRTTYIPLNIYLRDDEWDASRQEIVKRQDRRMLNVMVQDRLAAFNSELLRLQMSGALRRLTDSELIKRLTGEGTDDGPVRLFHFYDKFIASVPNERTRQLYEATRSKIEKFCGASARDLTFEDITVSWLRAFEADMAMTLKINSRSIHFRNLRAVFNAAIDDDLISCYPFRRFHIKSQETAKLALTLYQLRRLHKADVDPFMRKYIDIYFLGFYLIGINMVDMARLAPPVAGRITYERAKTHKFYSIRLEPEAQEIMERYPGKNGLLSFFDNAKSYRSISFREGMNLHKIGKQIGIPGLTYYSCRHTWATLASELDIPDDVIALALGHSRRTVTDVYIRRNLAKVDAANRRVIDYFLGRLDK